MHIPTSMLHGQVCPVTLAVGGLTVAAATKMFIDSQEKPSPATWAGVTALIFALQMLNFPVANGTSGHLVGGVLAASLLGIPAGILSLVLVLTVQAVLFADGGINALGANVINMALIGAGLGGSINLLLQKMKFHRSAAMALASFISVVTAAFACSLEVAASGIVAYTTILKAMIPVHALIGIGEAVLAVAVFEVLTLSLRKAGEIQIRLRLVFVCAAALLVAPLACAWPDGLESVAGRLHLNFSQTINGFNVFKDYQLPGIPEPGLSTLSAGLAGVLLLWFLTWGLASKLERGQTC